MVKKEALNCSWTETVEEFCIWGGVPRYWDLRLQEPGMKAADPFINFYFKFVVPVFGKISAEPLFPFCSETNYSYPDPVGGVDPGLKTRPDYIPQGYSIFTAEEVIRAYH